MDTRFFSGLERPDMEELHNIVEWPEFIYHDTTSEKLWHELYEKFPKYQYVLMDRNEVIGTLNSIPLSIEDENGGFDDRGWDWALEKGFEDMRLGKTPTTLCGLQIGIGRNNLGKGISRIMIEKMRRIAEGQGFKRVILPVRPTMKHKYPLINMEEYMRWKTPEGLPYDPWIRAHVRLGAEIISVCPQSMYIPGSIKDWEEWTGLSIQSSGEYVFAGGLSPLSVSIENNRAEYSEPNVWMEHKLR